MRCYICDTLHGQPNVPFCSEEHAEKARQWLKVALTETCQDAQRTLE